MYVCVHACVCALYVVAFIVVVGGGGDGVCVCVCAFMLAGPENRDRRICTLHAHTRGHIHYTVYSTYT